MKKKQDIGLSRGGKNTKVHALVDGFLCQPHNIFRLLHLFMHIRMTFGQ
jgi:hypothetical protein